MKLKKPEKNFIDLMLAEYSKIEGDELNQKLQKLFNDFPEDTNKFDVMIKVAALNKIYSTAITNINPVVSKINEVSKTESFETEQDYINLVDKICTIEWTNEKNISFKRNNTSFASKYVHFLSNRTIPIYDSYIWIIMQAYVAQLKGSKPTFANPNNYLEFHKTFIDFKNLYELQKYTNYTIDKFLWIYGRNLIKEIERDLGVDIEKAKSVLKRRLKAGYNTGLSE